MAVTVMQGDIYWVLAKDLDISGSEQQKSRPYLIVSRTAINNLGDNVVGVPLSSKVHKACAHRVQIPHQMMVKDSTCSNRPFIDSVALTDHIRVIDKNRLEQPKMGRLSQTAVGGIELGLAYLFDIR
jgi:mRNA-degrading endonuclease toxin of MazEF toxin-antitoxin module